MAVGTDTAIEAEAAHKPAVPPGSREEAYKAEEEDVAAEDSQERLLSHAETSTSGRSGTGGKISTAISCAWEAVHK